MFKSLNILVISLAVYCLSPVAAQPIGRWQQEWPNTDFARAAIDLREIQSGGPGKDGIPAIDNPVFVPLADYKVQDEKEPVIGIISGNDARAYPLSVLIWHEIVNDVINGIPVTVTYCPLCNTAIVFDRRVDTRTLDFGTTGKLRHSDLVMYDRQTESWWQQFGGEAIVGELAGNKLKVLPSRLESLANFRKRALGGRILVPNDPAARDYGTNPYAGYDRSRTPFLFAGRLPKGVEPMMRVVAIDGVAWTLPLLVDKEEIVHGGVKILWHEGQHSALDSHRIAQGHDIGNVSVTRNGEDVAHVVTFAFAFFAFYPDGLLYTEKGELRQ